MNNKMKETKTNNDEAYKLSSDEFNKCLIEPNIKTSIAKNVIR